MTQIARFTVGRRNFLRYAGLGAGAVAAAAAVGVVAEPAIARVGGRPQGGEFADAAGRPNRPWWVRTVDTPTTEIDWSVLQRYDEGAGTVRKSFAKYVGKAEVDRLAGIAEETELQRMLNNVEGYTLRDQALSAAYVNVVQSFLGPQKADTPEKRGVPKWTGTPEEAARTIRAAMRHMGAASIGFFELDDNTRKLIYSADPDGKKLVFTSDRKASETTDTRYIPDTCKYVIVYTVQMSQETMRRCPTVTGSQTTSLAYKRGRDIQACTQEFLRGLGYQCLGESTTNALGIAPAMGVFAGLGEMSRLNRLITPEYGPMVRVFKMLTDLPVAVDKPINAGILEFCKHCKKCAESCPGEALSFDTEPTWQTRGGWNNPGHKAYFEDSTKCRTYQQEHAGTNCGICFAVCPFSKKDNGWVHDWVKASVSTAPAIDGFFRKMDDLFGYGTQASSEAWWGLDLPEFGIDSTQSVREA